MTQAKGRTFNSILIANRGEIAIRVAQAAAEMGIRSIAVYAEDDAASLHTRKTDLAVQLAGHGVQAYLDGDHLIEIALRNGCDALHPGYGFLSENAAFARKCVAAGISFIGAGAETLDLLGDKTKARDLAMRCHVPLVPGLNHSVALTEVISFFTALGEGASIMIKALAGGGGRGMQAVEKADDIPAAYARCKAEARAAFGCDDLYVEQLVKTARHIEVQIVGDGTGAVSHLWERECTLQRRNQKVVEIAPSPTLGEKSRQAIIEAALHLASTVKYHGIGTFEFLLDAKDTSRFYFMEANPRLQVEHTVTEEITGVDLVQVQIKLAAGYSLAEMKLTEAPARSGCAVQVRLNMESMNPDGSLHAAAGMLSAYHPPSGPGLRVDGYGYSGYQINPNYDPLLAKVIAKGQDYPAALNRLYRALCEFRIEGVASNKTLLLNLLQSSDVKENRVSTTYIETQISQLLTDHSHPDLFFDTRDHHGDVCDTVIIPPNCEGICAPGAGVLVSLEVSQGDRVVAGQTIAHLEAMKMEFPIKADQSGIIQNIVVSLGTTVVGEQVMFILAPSDVIADVELSEEAIDLDYIRDDLADVIERHALLEDERRPEAVARRHAKNMRTARENIDDLLDDGSFNEYGAMVLAAQRKRLTDEQLIKASPADGLIAGTGTVNGDLFEPDRSRCVALSYDYTVFAGTQGVMNHKKADRMLGLAQKWQIPVIIFAEGGGGRPSDTDFNGVAGLDCHTFVAMAGLSGLVPTVGIVAGRCFAGNAALLGVCDVIIATRSASIGMAGPAMIKGGGLGSYKAEEVGPVSVQEPNGVIDILVEDESDAVTTAKKYISYFQGALADWQCADQRMLRHLIPENRMRVYDMREVIKTLADDQSVLELRPKFAPGMITAFIRIEGRPFGLMANNPGHMGGAIDGQAGDKAARFMQLCDAFDIPMISLCDTPGFMVGPESEKQATVRHVSRIFVAAGSMTVPFFTVVLRKGYGLGAQAMAAGSFHSPVFTASWPSGEFGAMGVEGAIRLAYSKQLAALDDDTARQEMFDGLVAKLYENGKALNTAAFLEIDAVIDPLETRHWIVRGLNSTSRPAPRDGKKRPYIDTW